MSTPSTVTASAACDQTLGDDSKLLNHMCALAIARGDGTLLDATFILEEDIFELCVKVGQVHPEGVLLLLVTELIIVFQSSEEMLAMACVVTKAMAWHEGPTKLYNSSPSMTHLRAYIDGRNASPLGTQYLTPEREEVPQSSPSNSHPEGRAPHLFHMDLRDLGDDQLQQLMGASGR